MKRTGVEMTRSEATHFQSIANHVLTHTLSIDGDMRSILNNTWEGVDKGFAQGKVCDLIAELKAVNQVLIDMLPELGLENLPQLPGE